MNSTLRNLAIVAAAIFGMVSGAFFAEALHYLVQQDWPNTIIDLVFAGLMFMLFMWQLSDVKKYS